MQAERRAISLLMNYAEAQLLLQTLRSAINFQNRENSPSKKEHGQIFYSKLHFDLSKSSEQESKAEYYTVKEAMEKFKLSRDSVYGILQFHQINREKNGRFVRFLKVEFDRIMGVRK